ncbi:hypothetical protein IE81DRAFT_348201 [Ceraceosorus guamensis]|uniref:Uncharacterized protein n=1 Tax=Ceraceosorus guamensis TaxID=1522189 RepID=A0A316VZ13_9BASI|nr:hypothetical protein IE81DRAFT_348201 [Ceraceosorus guamensis]PWN41633.1 hypothetical protein IE81DRAFT_348201 [Ceraceosorus guamensis]
MSNSPQESWRAALQHNVDVIIKVSGLNVLPHEVEAELEDAHERLREAGKGMARALETIEACEAQAQSMKNQEEMVRTQAAEIKRLNAIIDALLAGRAAEGADKQADR